MKEDQPLELVKRIKALADTGLVFSRDGFDRERYAEILEKSLKLLGHIGNQPLTVLNDFFMPEKDYPTAKVDIRGLVLNDKSEILMVKEQVDSKWTIPGGWADIGYTPSEIVVKEIKEDTGLDCTVDRLLAVFDKRMHAHPPQPFYVYKLVFLCEVISGKLEHGFDLVDEAFFNINNLPPLSEDRIVWSQLELLYKLANDKTANVYFD